MTCSTMGGGGGGNTKTFTFPYSYPHPRSNTTTHTLCGVCSRMFQFPPPAPPLLSSRHRLNLLAQRTPVVGLQFRVFNPLLAPVLMQPADMILAHMEVQQLIADTFLDEHTPGMLLDYRLLVLQGREIYFMLVT